MMSFGVDTHTFWLNMIFIPVGLGLLWLRWHHMKQDRQKQAASAAGE
jgi:hypothetical protein